jgi:hypothetical protein
MPRPTTERDIAWAWYDAGCPGIFEDFYATTIDKTAISQETSDVLFTAVAISGLIATMPWRCYYMRTGAPGEYVYTPYLALSAPTGTSVAWSTNSASYVALTFSSVTSVPIGYLRGWTILTYTTGEGTVKVELLQNSRVVDTYEQVVTGGNHEVTLAHTLTTPIVGDIADDWDIRISGKASSGTLAISYQTEALFTLDGVWATQGNAKDFILENDLNGALSKLFVIENDIECTHLTKDFIISHDITARTYPATNTYSITAGGSAVSKSTIANLCIELACFTPESGSGLHTSITFDSAINYALNTVIAVAADGGAVYQGKVHQKRRSKGIISYTCTGPEIELTRFAQPIAATTNIREALYAALGAAQDAGIALQRPLLVGTAYPMSEPQTFSSLLDLITAWGEITGSAMLLTADGMLYEIPTASMPVLTLTVGATTDTNLCALLDSASQANNADAPALVIGEFGGGYTHPWYGSYDLTQALPDTANCTTVLTSKTRIPAENSIALMLTGLGSALRYNASFKYVLTNKLYAKAIEAVYLFLSTSNINMLQSNTVVSRWTFRGHDVNGTARECTFFCQQSFKNQAPIIAADRSIWFPIGGSKNDTVTQYWNQDATGEWWAESLEVYLWPIDDYAVIDGIDIRAFGIIRVYSGVPGRSVVARLRSTSVDTAQVEAASVLAKLQVANGIEVSVPLRLSLAPPFRVAVTLPTLGITATTLTVYQVTHDIMAGVTRLGIGTGLPCLVR